MHCDVLMKSTLDNIPSYLPWLNSNSCKQIGVLSNLILHHLGYYLYQYQILPHEQICYEDLIAFKEHKDCLIIKKKIDKDKFTC